MSTPVAAAAAVTVTELCTSDVVDAITSTICDAELCPADCTSTGPVIAPSGIFTVSEVADAKVGFAATTPVALENTTVLLAATGSNPVPIKVSSAPRDALAGAIDDKARGALLVVTDPSVSDDGAPFCLRNCKLPLELWPSLPLKRTNCVVYPP